MKEFLAAMDAEERRLVELIGFLEAGVIATRPPAPPVSEVVAQSLSQLTGLRALRAIYADARPVSGHLN